MEILKHFSRALRNILSEEFNTSIKLLNTKEVTYLPSLEIPPMNEWLGYISEFLSTYLHNLHTVTREDGQKSESLTLVS